MSDPQDVQTEKASARRDRSQLRVLHLLTSWNLGGAEKVAIEIIKGSSPQAYGIYMSRPGPVRNALIAAKIPFQLTKAINPLTVGAACRLHAIDIVYAHDFTALVVAALARTKVAIVAQIHHNPPWLARLTLRRTLFLRAAREARVIIFVGQWGRDLPMLPLWLQEKITVIPNCIDAREVQMLAKQIQVEPCDVLFVGRLSPEKDPLRFLELVKTVKSRFPGLRAGMVGTGPLMEQCKIQIQRYGLESSVRIYGFQENPYPYIAAAKCVVVTSKREGFGLAAIESIALGVPVIATNTGGLKEIVVEGVGRLCDTNDSFVSSIVELLNGKFPINRETAESVLALYGDREKWKSDIQKVLKAI
jgi:glycosyltransferase involved in cell wall biosynthesis